MALCDELEARQQKRNESRTRLSTAAIDKLLTAREPDEFAEHWQRICDHFDLLSDTPESIGQLRQAIIGLACSGGLTSGWRKLNQVEESGEMILRSIGEKREEWFREEAKEGNREASRIEAKLRKHRPIYPTNPEIPASWTWASLLEAC